MARFDAFELQHVRADMPGVAALLAELDTYLRAQYPVAEFGQDLTHILSEQALLHPAVTLHVALDRSGQLLGSAALRRTTLDNDGVAGASSRLAYGEIKRVYVRPHARGLGVGRALVHSLVDVAQRERMPKLMLETGTRQPEAQALFARCGFGVCSIFGDYTPNPVSIYMERLL